MTVTAIYPVYKRHAKMCKGGIALLHSALLHTKYATVLFEAAQMYCRYLQ